MSIYQGDAPELAPRDPQRRDATKRGSWCSYLFMSIVCPLRDIYFYNGDAGNGGPLSYLILSRILSVFCQARQAM